MTREKSVLSQLGKARWERWLENSILDLREAANVNGSNYLMVYGTGTPQENAIELLAAYEEAKKLPRYVGSFDTTTEDPITIYKGQYWWDSNNTGDYRVATNTIINGPANTVTGSSVGEFEALNISTTVIISPGVYTFTSIFTVNTSGINFVSLTGNRDVIINTSVIFSGSHYVIKGFLVSNSLRFGTALADYITFINCKCTTTEAWAGYQYGAIAEHNTFIDCEGGAAAFGIGSGTLYAINGTYIRCKGGDYSFGSNNNFVGKCIDCEAGQYSYGSTDGEYTSNIEGTLIRCCGGEFSFGYNANTNLGKYYYCIQEGVNGGIWNGNTFAYCAQNDLTT